MRALWQLSAPSESKHDYGADLFSADCRTASSVFLWVVRIVFYDLGFVFMNWRACVAIIPILFSGFVLADEGDRSLFLDGGMASLLATKDTFVIEYIDQVSDGCLPYPSRMKDKMELVLRQNGFSISSEDLWLSDKIVVNALGYATNSSSCVVYLEADLIYWANVVVPHAQLVPGGSNTVVQVGHALGGTLLTGTKNQMQGRVEEQVKEFGERAFLEISRSRDQIESEFPEIMDHYSDHKSK